MRLLNLLALVSGAFAAALPNDANSECGRAYLEVINTGGIPLYSDAECHTLRHSATSFSNRNCGLCVWFEGANCDGKQTYKAGRKGKHSMATSNSYRCNYIY